MDKRPTSSNSSQNSGEEHPLAIYADLVRIYPDNPSYLHKYGDLLIEAGQITTATEVLRRLYDLLIKQGENDKARKLIREYPLIGKVIAPSQDSPEDPMMQIIEGKLGRLWTMTNQKKIREGQYIFREGEFGDTLYIVLKGEVAIFKKDAHGRAVLLNLIQAGDIFGENGFLNPGPRSADVVANQQSIIIEIPRKKTLEFILNYPHLQEGLEMKSDLRHMTGLISINGILQNIPMLMRQHLAAEARIKHYSAKSIIHRAGEELVEVDMLLRGKAAYVMPDGAGGLLVLDPLRIGELVGDTSAVLKSSCPADLMAIENVSMAHIPYSAFKNVVEAYPPLREALMRHAQVQRARFMRTVSRQGRK